MKHTLEQLQEKTNAELDEICALAQGFFVDSIIDFVIGVAEECYATDAGYIPKQKYTPTTNKEQAWDLMVKYSLIVDVHWSGAHYIHYGENDSFIDNETDLLRAVTIASILAAQGE